MMTCRTWTAAVASDWSWRLVGVVAAGGDVGALSTLVQEASGPVQRSAAGAAAAAAGVAAGHGEECLELLDRLLLRDDAAPIDHAWLLVHRARLRFDLGDREGAGADAASVQRNTVGLEHDVTALCLSGVASGIMLQAAGFAGGDLGDALRSGDTPTSWWDSQQRAWGFATAAQDHFDVWAHRGGLQSRREDLAQRHLSAAARTANLSGDHSRWRTALALAAQDLLVAPGLSADRAHEGLRQLRAAGDRDNLKLGLRRLIDDGPRDGVRALVSAVDLSRSTSTTARCDLLMLQLAGGLLARGDADRHVSDLLAALSGDAVPVLRRPSVAPAEHEILDALDGVVLAAGHAAQVEVARLAVALPPQTQGLVVDRWARVFAGLPAGVWPTDGAAALADAASAHREPLRRTLLGIAARNHGPAELLLVEEVRAGVLEAWHALPPGDLADDVFDGLLAGLEDHVCRLPRRTPGGGVTYPAGGSHAQALVRLSAGRPARARWTAALEYIEDDGISPQDKVGALIAFAVKPKRLPPDVRARARAVAAQHLEHVPEPDPFRDALGHDDVTGAAFWSAWRLGALDAEQVRLRLVALVAAGKHERVWAARVAGLPGGDDGLLLSLAHDHSARVRRAAAFGVGRRILADGGTSHDRALAGLLEGSTGRSAPLGLVEGLLDGTDPSVRATELLDRLVSHPDAVVRHAARGRG